MGRQIAFLASAAIFAHSALYGQHDQQPTAPFTFKTLASTGDHRLSRNALVEGVALNDAGDVAFVLHWTEYGRERTALYTQKHLVAQDGDVIDGKRLARITATALAINTAGTVAYEVVIPGNPTQTAIFVERKYKVGLAQSGSPKDFVLREDGEVVLMAGVAAPALPTASDVVSQVTKRTGTLDIWRSVKARLPKPPVPIPDPAVALPDLAPKPKPLAKAAVPAIHPCAVPPFPLPGIWAVGDAMIGPIANYKFDESPKARIYHSPFFGMMAAPSRTIQCSADGTPLIITISDTTGHYEIWTPIGLLTRTRDDGTFEIPGISASVITSLLVHADTPLRINRHAMIAMPLTFDPEGFAIVLATPVGGPR